MKIVAGTVHGVLRSLPAGSQATVAVSPRADFALDLKFDAPSGDRHECTLDVYLTHGLQGRIGVEIDSSMSCVLRFDETSVWP